jgi:hypothetical protein
MNELARADSRALHEPFATILATRTPDDAFRWIIDVLGAQPNNLRSSNSHLVAYTGSDLALDWFESSVASPVSNHWGSGAALLGVSWPRLSAWLKFGGPRTLMALDALIAYRKPAPNMAPLAQIAAPVLLYAPSRSQFEQEVLSTLEGSTTPRIKMAIESVLKYSVEILRGGDRGVAVSELPMLFLSPEKFLTAQKILNRHDSVVSGVRKSIEALISKSDSK